MPAAAMASVTSATRSAPAAWKTSRTTSGRRWTPSGTAPDRAICRTRSRPPGSSGAIVTILAQPPHASSRRPMTAGSGSRMASGSWAPLRSRLMNGPSRWMPAGAGAGHHRGAPQHAAERRGGDAGEHAGGALAEVEAHGLVHFLRVEAGQPGAAAAVDVHVDEARHQPGAAQVLDGRAVGRGQALPERRD